MNPYSLLWFSFIVALAAGLAWFVDWGAKRQGKWSAVKRKRVFRLFLLGGIGFGLFAFFTDSDQRAITLFEVEENWGERAELVWEFTVEHPQAKHTLRVVPRPDPGSEASRPIALEIELADGGGAALVGGRMEFPIERDIGSGRGTVPRDVWRPFAVEFTPSRAGLHRLRIASDDGKPPVIFVRIEDPLKTDGRRAHGY